ncbi:hypothetical protein [Streptomyces noursei]|uniref:phosphotriesterase family protein n=1 Tax=Streptomyces noursei TaxID=1971 RepID=UPI0030F12E52
MVGVVPSRSSPASSPRPSRRRDPCHVSHGIRAEDLTAEITEGIGKHRIRPGIIGEIGSDRDYISPAEEKSFRAAARAHLHTGLTITTHASHPGST